MRSWLTELKESTLVAVLSFQIHIVTFIKRSDIEINSIELLIRFQLILPVEHIINKALFNVEELNY